MADPIEELIATRRELEAQIASAPHDSRGLLEQQLAALTSTIALLRGAQPSLAAMRAHRPTLDAATAAFFRPQPPTELPAWIPDSARRAEISEADMRCPHGAQVYADASSLGCGIPGVPGVSLGTSHGLQLRFQSDGGLAGQSFYERGLLRWSIDYHATSGRSAEGWYASTEPKVYLEHGLHTRYAANGTVVSQATFVGGVRDGWQKLWEDDGFPIGATRYAGGVEAERVLADGTRCPS